MTNAAGSGALRAALGSLTAALETKASLSETIVMLERGLGAALGAERVEIRLYLEATAAVTGDDRDVVLPVVVDGETIGEVALQFALPPSPERRSDAESLMGPLAATLLWRLQSDDRVRLRKIARTDTLTGLANRLAFDERLRAAMRSCSERGAPLALAFLDIDFFKTYNDVYGHVAGDDCLRRVARGLAAETDPQTDLLARYGGEEFALISEGATEAQAIELAARMLERLAESAIPHAGSSVGRVTISAGISGRIPSIADSASDMLRDADRALYRAKRLGRNRIAAEGYVSSATLVTRRVRAIGAPPRFDDATIGREADIARVDAALRNARMITLVGPAGIGKSRIARAVGIAAQGTVPDGVAYVDLGVLDAASDPIAVLAAALEAGASLPAIIDVLRDRTMLVILDDAASPDRRVESLCDELLEATDGLSILATARHPLGCRRERVVVVPPLADDAALALLRDRAGPEGDGDAMVLRRIAESARGVPSALESIARHLAANGPEATLIRLR